MSVDRCCQYLHFLKRTAKVGVRNLKIENLMYIKDDFRYELHAYLVVLLRQSEHKVKVYIGMYELCWVGCTACAHYAFQCEEYGPLQNLTYVPHHYSVFYIHDRQINSMASQMSETLMSEADVQLSLNARFPTIVTCDNLVLWIGENMHFRHDGQEQPNPLPREVLEGLVDRWSVKTVELKFRWAELFMSSSMDWLDYELFTEFGFEEPTAAEGMPRRKMECVKINLRHSELISEKILEKTENEQSDVFDKLVLNIRMLFPTDNVHVYMPRYEGDESCFSVVIQRYLNLVWPVRNFNLDMFFFPSKQLQKVDQLVNIPEHGSISMSEYDGRFAEFPSKVWKGESLKYNNSITKCNFSFHFFTKA